MIGEKQEQHLKRTLKNNVWIMFIRTRFRTRDINLPAWGNHPPRATIPLGELDRYQSSGQLGLFVAVWGGGGGRGGGGNGGKGENGEAKRTGTPCSKENILIELMIYFVIKV
jgi:hypothetical protein